MPAPVSVREEGGITRVLFDTGTLFHLYIGRWTANKKMNESDLLIDEVDVFFSDDFFGKVY